MQQKIAANLTPLLVVGALVLFTLMGGVAGDVAKMHPPGGAQAQPAQLATPGAVFGDPDRIDSAARTWKEWREQEPYARERDWPEGHKLAIGWFGLDVLFALVIGALVVRLQHLSKRRAEGFVIGNLLHPDHGDQRLRAAWAATRWAAWLPVAYVAADIIENLLAVAGILIAANGLSTSSDPAVPRVLMVAIGLTSFCKWFTLAGAVAPIIVSEVVLRRLLRQGAPRPALRLKPQIVAAAVFGVLFVRQDQIGDVVRTWGDEGRWHHGLTALLLSAFAALVIATTGRALLDATGPPAPAPDASWPRRLLVLGFALAAVPLLVCWGLEQWLGTGAAPWAVGIPGVVVAVVGVLSLPPSVAMLPAVPVPPFAPEPQRNLLRVLVAAPLLALMLAAVKTLPSGLFLRVFDGGFFNGEDAAAVAVPAAVALGCAIALVTWVAVGHPLPAAHLWTLGGIVGAICVLSWWHVEPVTDAIGGVGAVGLFSALVVLMLHPIALLALHPARGALRLVGWRRLPTFTLLLVWVLLGSVIDRGGFHDARLVDAEEQPAATTLEEAWRDWLSANAGETIGAGAARPTAPLVFVATSGGATRSAYWTSLVFDCLFQADSTLCDESTVDEQRIFVASGISGGSVGLAVYRSLQAADGSLPPREEGSPSWYEAVYERDLLAPTITRLLFVDLPNAFTHLSFPGDRAATLEEQLEAAAKDASPAQTLTSSMFAIGSRFPRLVLNSASVEDGCRFNGSTLELAAEPGDANDEQTANAEGDQCLSIDGLDRRKGAHAAALAGTRDLSDFVCDGDGQRRDIRLSTVALLSARFPYVTPSGALRSCANPKDRTFLVDGGTLDSSAASPVVELLAALRPAIDAINSDQTKPCITPVLLQLDNGYTEVAAPLDADRPWELFAPIQAALAGAGSQADRSRQEAALAFGADPSLGTPARLGPTAPYCPGARAFPRYVHVAPSSHPGVESAMGWTLSDQSRRDLAEQVRNPSNRKALATVRACWFGVGTSADRALAACPDP